MRRNIQKFILVHAANGDSGAKRPNDDYDIWDNKGEIIGRVFRAANAPKNQPWFWIATVQAPHLPTERGYAATREDAMAAFKRAWLGARLMTTAS